MRLRNPWRSESPGHYRRRFGRPTNLDPGERVLLVFEQLVEGAQIALNGQPLEGLVTDITERLEANNEITVRVRPQQAEAAGPQFVGHLVADVRLEIHSASD